MALEVLPGDAAGVARAAELLRAGLIVGFPTDTVYGLAALASHERAVRRVYAVKGRSLSQPLVVMVADPQLVAELAEVGPLERSYMERFWPGPLTLVLRSRGHLRPPLVAGEPAAVGVRVPDHPLALALLREVGAPLATTSANRSGEPPALTPVEAAWLGGLAAVLDGGRAPGGVASTVLDLSGPLPRILRPGPITVAQLGLEPR